jgi:uncharacterized protein
MRLDRINIDIFTKCIYNQSVKFEWDERKRSENLRKHAIDFIDVPTMFDSLMLVKLDDRQQYGEDRWIGIGLLRSIIVVVVYVERKADIIRIISARKANLDERKKFEQSL